MAVKPRRILTRPQSTWLLPRVRCSRRPRADDSPGGRVIHGLCFARDDALGWQVEKGGNIKKSGHPGCPDAVATGRETVGLDRISSRVELFLGPNLSGKGTSQSGCASESPARLAAWKGVAKLSVEVELCGKKVRCCRGLGAS